MSGKNVLNVLTDEDGFVIVNIGGKDFVSTEPIQVLNGKFRAKDIINLIFEEV